MCVYEIAWRDVVGPVFEWNMLCVNIKRSLGPFDPFGPVCVAKGVEEMRALVVGVTNESEDLVGRLIDSVAVVGSDEDTKAHELIVRHAEFTQYEAEFDLVDVFVVDNFAHDACGSVGDRVGVGGVDGGDDALFLECGRCAFRLGFCDHVWDPDDFTESLCLVHVFGGEVGRRSFASVLREVRANVFDLFGSGREVFVFVFEPVASLV